MSGPPRGRRELEARLDDWAAYLRDQNGDVDPDAWAAIDALLDEYAARLRLELVAAGIVDAVPYAPAGNPEFAPDPRLT